MDSGYVLDDCHDQIKAGDAFIASYRGTPGQRFEVLEDMGTGLFKMRRPDGEESLIRPAHILSVADRIIRPGKDDGLTGTERAYVGAYRNVLAAVYDCTAFVSSSLAGQVDALEAQLSEERIEELREIAREG